MAKSFHELSPRTQMVVFALLSALTVAAAWQILLGPAQAEIASRRARLSSLDGQVGRARAVAARLPAAQREVKQLEASLRQTEAVIPEEKDPAGGPPESARAGERVAARHRQLQAERRGDQDAVHRVAHPARARGRAITTWADSSAGSPPCRA